MSNLNLPPEIRPNKNFIFKGKKYPVDFSMIKHYSNYFFENQNNYELLTDIEISEEKIEITDEAFQNFVSCCQNQNFQLTDSNVLSIHQLSLTYDVPSLIKLTNEYISKSSENLVFDSIRFKFQNQLDLHSEEITISSNFHKYINDERLLSLPISILYRILKSDSLKIDENQIADFLFKCLDKYGRKASILFTNFNFENKKIDLYSRLINNYSDVFDFNMINPKFLLNTTNELLSKLNSLTIEYSKSLLKVEQLIESQKNQFQDQLKKISELQNEQNEKNSKQNQFQDQINRITKLQNEQNDKQNQFQDQLKKISELQNEQNDKINKQNQFQDQINKITKLQNEQNDKQNQFQDQLKKISELQNEQNDKINKQNQLFIQAENDRKAEYDKQLINHNQRFNKLDDNFRNFISKNESYITKSISLVFF